MLSICCHAKTRVLIRSDPKPNTNLPQPNDSSDNIFDCDRPAVHNDIHNKMFKSFASKENIHKNTDGSDCTVSNNKFSSVTLCNWH